MEVLGLRPMICKGLWFPVWVLGFRLRVWGSFRKLRVEHVGDFGLVSGDWGGNGRVDPANCRYTFSLYIYIYTHTIFKGFHI